MYDDSFEARLAGQAVGAPKRGGKIWIVISIILFVLLAAAVVFAVIFFNKSQDTSSADSLKKKVTDQEAQIAVLESDKHFLKSKVSDQEKTIQQLTENASNAQKEIAKPNPVTVTKSEIIEASKKLTHELNDSFKVMINSDYSYVVVEGTEKSTGAGMYLYRDNRADSDWKFLIATQSVLGCEEASADVKKVLHGLVACENSDNTYGTF